MSKVIEHKIGLENEKSESTIRLEKLLIELQELLISENHAAILYGRLNILVAEDNTGVLTKLIDAHEGNEYLKSKGAVKH